MLISGKYENAQVLFWLCHVYKHCLKTLALIDKIIFHIGIALLILRIKNICRRHMENLFEMLMLQKYVSLERFKLHFGGFQGLWLFNIVHNSHWVAQSSAWPLSIVLWEKFMWVKDICIIYNTQYLKHHCYVLHRRKNWRKRRLFWVDKYF